MNKYKKKDKTFEESNIYIFCSDIILNIENGENEKLDSTVKNYKNIYDLDEYMSFILKRIIDRENQKRKIKEEEEEKEKEINEEKEQSQNEEKIKNNIDNNDDNIEVNNKNPNEENNFDKIEKDK